VKIDAESDNLLRSKLDPRTTWDTWDLRFLSLAQLVASWSKDPSTQTGAVLVHEKRVLSMGFNGFPQGMSDKPEWLNDRTEKYSRIVHCEVNALIFAGRVPFGTTLYTFPFLSCDRCVVQMLQAGVRRFVAPTATDDQLTRWGAAFERTRQYIHDTDPTWGACIEIPRHLICDPSEC
jgi:dCMP deaminase